MRAISRLFISLQLVGNCNGFVGSSRGHATTHLLSTTNNNLSTTSPLVAEPSVVLNRVFSEDKRPIIPSVAEPSVVLDRVFSEDKRPIILFDGVCNLCNNAVNLALDWDPSGKLRFAALQSNVGRSLLQSHGREADDISSIVFVTNSGAYIKSDAILGITEELNPLPILSLKPFAKIASNIVPQFLRDLIYDGVADNRYSIMGKRDECRMDYDGEFTDRFVDDSLANA